MFSIQVKTIFRVFGQACLQLAEMPAAIGDDAPHVGTEGAALVHSNLAAETFGDSVEETDPAIVFAAKDTEEIYGVGGSFAAVAEPEYRMLVSAGEFTREQFNDIGWSDDALIAAGHMEVVSVPKLPPPPPAPLGLPPAPPSVPGSTQANAPSPGANVMLDADGAPWDERIHSSGRTQTKDLRWTKKKGVDAAYHSQVTAQITGGGAAKPPFVPLNASAPPPPVSAPPAPPAPPAAAGTDAIDFVKLCKLITSNKIELTKVQKVAMSFGVQGLTDLNKPENRHLIPLAYAALQ